MFEPQKGPRVFACPPGADFPKLLVHGLLERVAGRSPEDIARVQIIVNTRRMHRRIVDLFHQEQAMLLPNIRLITDLVYDFSGPDLAPAVSPLRRRLELSQLISGLLEKQPDLSPKSALFDLADSLALLLGEMNDEGVSPNAIRQLDVTDSSGHWQRSHMFLAIVDRFFGAHSGEPPDENARLREIVVRLIRQWQNSPPHHPIIVAGSTGSRGTTAMLMQAVARLPQGALVLPGFDFDLPEGVWARLDNTLAGEDHPQFRFAKLLSGLSLGAEDVGLWSDKADVHAPNRNRLFSLALRPAPVTSQWMHEGPAFKGVTSATGDMALIEAPSARAEAVAISLVMRQAAETGQTVALVTPDRTLTRQVTASLDRWGIEPDVSVGAPLTLSAPGRLLLHVAEQFGRRLTAEALLTILKHPLVNSGDEGRGQHLLWARELEGQIRRFGPPFPLPPDLIHWQEFDPANLEKREWVAWINSVIGQFQAASIRSVAEHLKHHISATETLAAGPSGKPSSALWDKATGLEAARIVAELIREADHGGRLAPIDYATLFRSALSRGEVRDPVRPHPNVMIWGTLEARVQGADLVILGGLNEGVWPESPTPDPWLNRQMRLQAGLLLPERRIGLSAHDFQQAVGAKQVILSRALRDADSETVASRWVNRLTNLLQGMSDEGRGALVDMRRRGQNWLDLVRDLEQPKYPVPAAGRPSPQPPIKARPRSLSVTAVSRLIRDPYAIYAASVLRLRKMDALRQLPDAPLRGTVLHAILEKFIRQHDGVDSKSQLLAIADEVLARQAPWPAARILWRAKLERVADAFLGGELIRRAQGQPAALETKGVLEFPNLGFTLFGTADRIDRGPDGSLSVFDYKTGAPPSSKQLQYFDKQLLLEAMMAEAGAFDDLPPAQVSEVAHIGLGSTPKFAPIALAPGQTTLVRKQFVDLIDAYQLRARGYTSRRAMAEWRFAGDYDHLARFGEWDETQEPVGSEVG